jgi:predicted alpha/beta hydrolase
MTPASVSSADIVVPACDGRPLAATLYRAQADAANRAVLIGSAMGVPRRFYARFARYLAQRGFTVLTFDYRGAARSARSAASPRDATLHDWGEQDLNGAIDWLARTWGGGSIAVVAHSVSAQLLGLADNNRRLKAIVLVAPQSGYWRLFDGFMKLRVAAGWFVAIPVLAALMGRVPGWVLGGTDLPGSVAREWARWGRHPDYILSYRNGTREGFARIVAPLLVYRVSDDAFAPARAAAAIVGWYGSRQREVRVLSPGPRERPIGHFGFFMDRCAGSAWPETADWLSRTLASAPPAGVGDAPGRAGETPAA